MLTLHELQAKMRADLLAERPAGTHALDAAIVGDGLSPAQRVQIHRNHVFLSLSEALAGIYPAVVAMVGEAFFKAAVRAFIADYPPTEPMLARYGAGLDAFLGNFEPAGGLPYLPDLARLEWALHESFHASDQSTLSQTALAAVPQEELPGLALRLHSSARLIASDWPVDALWQATRPDADVNIGSIDLASDSARAFILRQDGDVRLWSVPSGEWHWLAALDKGSGLGEASAQALALDGTFDLGRSLGRHLEFGSFAPLDCGQADGGRDGRRAGIFETGNEECTTDE